MSIVWNNCLVLLALSQLWFEADRLEFKNDESFWLFVGSLISAELDRVSDASNMWNSPL